VAQEDLYLSEVHTLFQKVHGKTVPQRMDAAFSLDFCFFTGVVINFLYDPWGIVLSFLRAFENIFKAWVSCQVLSNRAGQARPG
jgi:hypothetical protein